MMDVLHLRLLGQMNSDVLHHSQIAVRDEVAMEHDVANEAFVARTHDHNRLGF